MEWACCHCEATEMGRRALRGLQDGRLALREAPGWVGQRSLALGPVALRCCALGSLVGTSAKSAAPGIDPWSRAFKSLPLHP